MNGKITGITNQVYHRIKTRILDLEFQFGKKINLNDLSEELQVSTTPVRNALVKLGEDGLVKFKPRQGYYMYAPVPKDVEEIYEFRKILELYAITSFDKKFNDFGPFEKVKKQIERVRNLPTEERRKKFAKTESIHTLIISTLNNEWVKKVYHNLHNFTLLFQHVIQHNAASIIDTGLDQHLSLINAILNKNIDQAMQIVEKHSEITVSTLGKLITDKTRT